VQFYNSLCNSSVTGKNKYSQARREHVEQNCNPTYGRVDELLSLLTKSKSLHMLMVLDRGGNPSRFSELKKLVDSSSTTIARRLNELELHGLVSRTQPTNSGPGFEYSITEDARTLSPILQSLFEWVDERSHRTV
jgi:DNA-binding HxlR family transcriptional regulator